jgi:hypothetical protein
MISLVQDLHLFNIYIPSFYAKFDCPEPTLETTATLILWIMFQAQVHRLFPELEN